MSHAKALFYEDKYYLFSNFSAHAVVYKGELYSTSEHAYQAAKFDDPAIKKLVSSATSPLEAKNIANKHKDKYKKNWHESKVAVMYEIVREKLLQHKEVQDVLSETTKEIVENSPVDYFWGCGKDGTGENQLGKVWMRLRGELKNTSR